MNRYVVRGIVEDLREGKRVVIIAFHQQDAGAVFHSVIRNLDDREVESFSFANGAEKLLHVYVPGALHVLDSPAQAEGTQPDVILAVDWHLQPESVKAHLMYLARRGTELIRL